MNDKSTEDGYVTVSSLAYGREEVESTTIKVPNFYGLPTARVTVGSHYTKNLGNYESAKISVEISLPCLPNEEEVVRVYDLTQSMVAAMLEEQISNFK